MESHRVWRMVPQHPCRRQSGARARARRGGGFEARALFARRDPKPRAQAASEHAEDEVRDTLKPIAEILREAGEWERAARVTREWVGVSAAPDAPEAFCELLEASPVGIPFALEFTLDTKRHWFRRRRLDHRTVDRIVLAIAAEEHRRAAGVLRRFLPFLFLFHV